MPLAQDTYLKIAGNTVINTELFGLSQGLENVIGTGGAAQGFTNADVKGPIPNPAIADLVNYVEIPMNVFIRNGSGDAAFPFATGGANAFPPTTLILPFAGRLSNILWQTVTGHILVVYRADIAVLVSTLAANAGVMTGATVGSTIRFKKGETFTVLNFPSATVGLTVGDTLEDELIHVPADYLFWFVPEDP